MLKDTIISAFNYDGTLLKWLKKVEKALQGDTLTNIEVVTNSDYSMQLKLTFGDNSFIMSPVFTNKGRGIVSITKTATSGLVDTYTVTYTDNTTSTFTVTNAEGFNANNLYATLTAGTGIELTNNGQNVTVTAKRLLNEIVDSQGRLRFVEGNLRTDEYEGFTYLYAKWSLSGTHLMLVLAGKIAAGTTTPANARLAVVNIPASLSFIHEKLIPISSGGGVVDVQDFKVRSSTSWSAGIKTWEAIKVVVAGGYSIAITTSGPTITVDTETSFRIKFDFLIDTD